MFRKLIILLAAVLLIAKANAQSDSSHLRISLLTCGVGEELYSSFGHTGVRVIDSVKGMDVVYSYGTFDFSDPDFYTKFIRGKLLYYASKDVFEGFMQEYVYEHRKVGEQVLLLNGEQKQKIYSFLEWNVLPENRYYKYDFLFDNCATRIRDIGPDILGAGFKFGRALPVDSKITFRNIIDQYLAYKDWERFGIDILLGSRIDKVMSNSDVMFLPDYLRDGLAGATLDGRKVAGETRVILPQGGDVMHGGVNGPFLLTCIIALLTIAGLTMNKLKVLGRVMSFILMLTTGLLGCLVLFMWLGTDHQACQNNWNILWALPTNIVFAFRKKRKDRYALIAILLLVVSLFLHLLHIQELPLLELMPLMVALLFVYGTVLRRSRTKVS
jgi:hypothetical protein